MRAALFEPLTGGEQAQALRLLLEDPRVASMANVGRYRVVASEPWVAKEASSFAGKRLASLVVYNYASNQCVEACINLSDNSVKSVVANLSQPMLAAEEEEEATTIALQDSRVSARLLDSEYALSATHYWSHRDSELAFSRRSAAVFFGASKRSPSFVAIVDLTSDSVSELVDAANF